jgi:hypothetical protein
MKFIVGILLAGVLGSGAAMAAADGCAGLDGSTFLSVNDHELGRTTHGIHYGKWSLSFERGAVGFRFSDAFRTAFFTCDPKEGEIKSDLLRGTAFYLASHSVLVWEGKWYRKLQPPPIENLP